MGGFDAISLQSAISPVEPVVHQRKDCNILVTIGWLIQRWTRRAFRAGYFHDKTILVRGVWSDITSDTHRYEELCSNDGCKTWAPSLLANLTRDEFDFDFGTWKSYSQRLLHPLSASTAWADLDGITVVHKICTGRANLAEYKGDGPAGHVELLALRWFSPNTHEWNLDFATPNVGMLGIPAVGQFKNGRADFYDQEQNRRQICSGAVFHLGDWRGFSPIRTGIF